MTEPMAQLLRVRGNTVETKQHYQDGKARIVGTCIVCIGGQWFVLRVSASPKGSYQDLRSDNSAYE
jgi:hypothetical protein